MKRKGDEYLPQILNYFNKGYGYVDICALIKKNYDYQLSLRTLNRILQENNLRRKNIIESPYGSIIAAIDLELEQAGCNLGYRAMTKRLQKSYNLTVKQKTVMSLLRAIDPVGVSLRRSHKLKRRNYRSKGPNFIWHVDGHDKLNRYGFHIHGAIDGFSRKVMWLEVCSTNKNPAVVAHHYLRTLAKHQFMPTLIRTDAGTENVIIASLQTYLRYHHGDDLAGERSYLQGKSTANQRIEAFWVQLQRLTTAYYMRLFKSMVDTNALDLNDSVQKDLLAFCFGPIIKHDLNQAMTEWNEHNVRHQPHKGFVGGKPDLLYELPEKFNATDCRQPVDLGDIEILYNKWTEDPLLYKYQIARLVYEMRPDFQVPTTAKEAFTLFEELRDEINLIRNN